nr:reverse transcriptase domain-containing protein [Tanacetum cinerariifolium]
MRTHSSSNLPGESSPNLTSSNPKRRNRRRSKQPFILEESPVDTMADQRTLVELLRAPTEGYAEAIVVPRFLLSNSRGSPSLARKRTPVFYSYLGGSCSKFINEFFPPSRTTNLHNEISNFQQRFDESFHEAWDRYKDLLYACRHHGFTELYQLDTFYNALNPADQDSLNSTVGGNLSERAVILKKLPEKLGDPGKFLVSCGFSELKYKALADLVASINLMPLTVWKKLGLPELISTRMTLELANRAIYIPAGIARDVFVPIGKFTFPADFFIVDY